MSEYNSQDTLKGLRQFIAGGRSKIARPVANNTTARLIGGGVAVKLHDTDVVTFYDNGQVALNSGGWLTRTTKERINDQIGNAIYQERGIWYINDKNGNATLFYDGMVLNAQGFPVKPRKTAAYEKRLDKIKKQAREYARDYVAALEAGKIDYPNGGDCWGCLMTRENGQQAFGTDHLLQHMKERYYVPSLLVNAGRAAGYQDFQIGLMGIGGRRLFIDPKRAIYMYIVKNLQRGL